MKRRRKKMLDGIYMWVSNTCVKEILKININYTLSRPGLHK